MDSPLQSAPWPNDIDPHSCGNSAFVPDVYGSQQNSCGSYKAGFGPGGCNKYTPNYPDDQYLAKHGCQGLGDCYNGVPPGPDQRIEPEQVMWPAVGYNPDETRAATAAGCNGCDEVLLEGFESSCQRPVLVGLLWLAGLYLLLRR